MNSWKLPQSIIDYYEPYRKNTTKTRVTTILNTKFEIDEKYEIIDAIGQGAYGIVVAARDRETDDFVAIKKIEKAFEHKIQLKRTLRELRILRLLKHENLIDNKMLILPSSRDDFSEIYIVSELMETDLASIIKSPQNLEEEQLQLFIYQLIRGLKYQNSAGILHRDLKPRNLLINSNCDQKICDFGLSRPVLPEIVSKSDKLTNYVTTRWYRAPEVLLGYDCYGTTVDMWSAGCIFAELMLRKPLLTGTSTKDQLKKVINLVGTPTEKELSTIHNPKAVKFIKSIPYEPGKDISVLLPDAHPLAIDLLKKMLTFDPTKRISNEEAQSHPYLSDLHDPEDEPSAEKVKLQQFDFELHSFTVEQYKDLIYEEIAMYNFKELNDIFDNNAKLGKSNVEHILNNDNKDQDCSDTSADNESIDWEKA